MNKTMWIFAGAAVCVLGLASSAMAQSSTFVQDSNGNISVGTTLAQNSAGFASVTNGANGPITTASTNTQSSAAQAQLTYNFRVVVPGNQPFSILNGTFFDVPLEIGFASTATLAPGASEAQAQTNLLVQSAIQSTAFQFTQDCEGDFGQCGSTGPLTSDFDYHLVFADFQGVLHSGALGFVVMTALANGGAFAQLDPMINFAPQFALDHPDWTVTMDAVPGLDGGVPEPASWALMIGGFGLAGAALRRRRALVAA